VKPCASIFPSVRAPLRDPTKPARPRTVAYLAVIVVGIVAGLALTEAWVRVARWTPYAQIVRDHCLRNIDGVPVWGCERVPDDVRRRNRACVDQHPERTRVLFLGSSITYGSELSAQQTFTTALEERLNRSQPAPGFCVLNFAEQGFQFEQKYAVARDEVPRYRPALIMWESWWDLREFRIIGDAAYAVSDYRLRPDGGIGIAGIPDRLNGILFRHSRLYEYFALRFGERIADHVPAAEAMAAFAESRLTKVVQLARSGGARLVSYRAPPLERSFAETVASPSPSETVLFRFWEEHGVPSYSLARELTDYDYRALRLDPCCHFNAAGHRALAAIMERIVLDQLGRRALEEGS
jgi:hypothetical protein